MKKKIYKSDEDYRGPRITVMKPTVVNVDNVPASENVASNGLHPNIVFTPPTEDSYEGNKKSFLLDDELAHFIPVERDDKAILCRNGNPVKYRDCDEYNTAFCRGECEFGAKEILIPDVNLENREDGK